MQRTLLNDRTTNQRSPFLFQGWTMAQSIRLTWERNARWQCPPCSLCVKQNVGLFTNTKLYILFRVEIRITLQQLLSLNWSTKKLFGTSLRSQTSSRHSIVKISRPSNSVSRHRYLKGCEDAGSREEGKLWNHLTRRRQNAPVTTRADLATNLGAQSLIRTMQKRAIPFGREWSISLQISSVRLDENEAHHFYSRNKKSRMTTVPFLDRSMSTLPDWRTVHRQTIPIPCANTFSSDQLECSFCSKFSVLLSQTKQNDKQYPDNYLRKVDWSRLLFSTYQSVRTPFDSSSQKRMQSMKGHL